MKRYIGYILLIAGFASCVLAGGDIVPRSANGQNLGTAAKPFGTIFVSTNSASTVEGDGGVVLDVGDTTSGTLAVTATNTTISGTASIAGQVTLATLAAVTNGLTAGMLWTTNNAVMVIP